MFRRIAVFLGLSVVVHAGLLKPDVDFSNYDKPLYGQIVDRIKTKVSARLGPGKNTRDRYFIIPFAYENRGNDPEYSHSFMSVIRVLADDKQSHWTPGLKRGAHNDREFEAFTISWLPHDFLTNPNLCVFEGIGARVNPKANQCPISVGRNCTLAETIKLGADAKNVVVMWGPYEISKAGFDVAVKRLRLLNQGKIRYRADDRLYQKDQVAINCFHAIAGLDDPFPKGGFLGTGFMMWGINGTARVLIEYNERAHPKGLILEPVNVKKDRYGFVYSPSPGAHGLYNPVAHASAYRK